MLKITDCHTDLLTEKTHEEQIEFIKNLPTNVKVLNLAVFTTDDKLNIEDLKKYKQQTENLQNHTKTRLLFSVEDIGSIQPNEIDELIKLKPFCVGLTWNHKNQYAGGALSTNGITKCGKDTIKKLEENNILIDTAHLNRKSFFKFVRITNKPILCTHANINSLHSHPRNLTDKQIQKIVDSNGFIGLTIYQKFMSSSKISAKDIAKQFDYLIKKYGHKNFGFGIDFFGVAEDCLPENIKSYPDLHFVATELKNLGYSTKIINHIFYKNFIEFLKRTNNVNFKC